MKPFNLEAALAGAKVVTRDKREAEIVSNNKNAKSGRVLIGWVDNEPYTWRANGSNMTTDQEKGSGDLFMAPTERKEYLVRHGNHCTLYSPFDSLEEAQYIATLNNGTIHEITIIE